MFGKVLKISGTHATVRIGRREGGCLACQGDCAAMKGEPAAEVAVVPGLREGQVVRLADHRWLFWWLKGAAFLFAFVFAATAARACLRAAGVAEAADKAAIVLGLAAGGLALWLAHRALRPKWRYAVVEILEVTRNAGTS